MNESELRDRLRAAHPADDPDSEERAWQVMRSAFSSPAPASGQHRRRLTVPVAACLLTAATIVLATASAPREALARWLREAIGLSAQPRAHPRRLLAGLPGGGQLLVNSPAGPWIVQADGRRHYLGPYTAAAWSPHSLYVVAWRRSELAALDPQGHPQWARTSSGRISVARWSSDGYRIAYNAGRSLLIVAGDGSGEHRLGASVASDAPAWQPRTGHLHRVAFVDRRREIELLNADTGARSWRIRTPATPRQVLWSPDGTRLLAVAAHQLTLYTVRGHRLATRVFSSGETVSDAAFAPDGDRLALTLRQSGQRADSVALLAATRRGLRQVPQILFSAGERVSGLSWSPSAQWLLAASPSADQWIFIGTRSPTRLAAVSAIQRQFQSGGPSARGFPELGGWQP